VKRPDTVISDAQMESFLYDYHIAKAMGNEMPYNENYKKALYVDYVLKKHGLTQAMFDTSMVWFARNPEVMSKIYERLSDRMKDEQNRIKRLIALREGKPLESRPGDSIDVWGWQRYYALTGMPLNNKLLFTLPSDSNFKARDTLRWNLSVSYPKGLPDSIHAPIMAMQIVYKNDSVLGEAKTLYSAGMHTLSLTGDTLGDLKEIRGFLYYDNGKQLRPLLTDSVSLMRYHATDTLLHGKDTVPETQPKKEEPAKVVEEKPVEQPVTPRRPPVRERPSANDEQRPEAAPARPAAAPVKVIRPAAPVKEVKPVGGTQRTRQPLPSPRSKTQSSPARVDKAELKVSE
jgi:hypothetical protein